MEAIVVRRSATVPIKPENRARYPSNWREIRANVLERAQNKCERCAAPNHETIARGDDGTYMLMGGEVHDAETGKYLGMARGSEYPVVRMTRVVLTIAHLDHTPENCDMNNLRAWCQKCHLSYDAEHHRRNSQITRRARSGTAELFPDAYNAGLNRRDGSAADGTSELKPLLGDTGEKS